MNKRISFFLLFFTIFHFLSVSAQTSTNETHPLVEILKEIETQYSVSFSFADEHIKDIRIATPAKNLTLDEVLSYLTTQTNLKFNALGNSIIVIIKNIDDAISVEFLDEILLTHFLAEGISLHKDGVTALEPKTFDILPGLIEPDILNIIQALPGIQSIDERISNLSLRGGTHDQNLILWDDIKMYQSGHFFGLISAFNPYLIEKVKISKNGTRAKYGDGVSGVIDMRTSNSIPKEASGGAGVNLIHSDAYATFPITKKLGVQLSVRRSLTDVMTTPTYDQYFKRIFQNTDITQTNTISQKENFYFYDLNGKLLYDLSERDFLRVNYLRIYNELDYGERLKDNESQDLQRSALTQKSAAAGISYERQWSSKFTTAAQASFSNYNLDATNSDLFNAQQLIQRNEVKDRSMFVRYKYKPKSNILWHGGYQFNDVSIGNLEKINRPLFRQYIKEVISTHGIFQEVEMTSKDKSANLQLGIRGNYITQFSKFIVEPRLSFNLEFLEHFRFEVLAEFKNQTASQVIDLQNDFLGIEKRRWISANETTIPVITSTQFSTGFHFKKNNFLFSVEGYVKDVDGITARSQGFQNQFQNSTAVGGYQVQGVDFLVQKKFNAFSTWLSYSLSANEYTFNFDDETLVFRNNIDTRHIISFAGTYTHKNLKIASGLNWQSGKPFTRANTETPSTDDGSINYLMPNTSQQADYLRIDLSATYRWSLSDKVKASTGISLWNILNKKSDLNTYYTLNGTGDIEKVVNTSLGITPNFSFRLFF